MPGDQGDANEFPTGWNSLKPFDERDTKNAIPGTYYVAGGETKYPPDPDTGTPEQKATARDNFWFSTMENNVTDDGKKANMVLNDDDIKQLTSLQVITHSRNENLEGGNETGSGTWFVVAICEKDGKTIKKLDNGQSLSWLSHSNWFKTSDNGNAWCRGRMFTRDDEIFKYLKSGDFISVWMFAGPNHRNHAGSGYLVLGFGNGPETYKIPNLRLSSNNAPLISVYAQKRQECLMIPGDGSSTEVKANIVHGGVDLMYQLLKKSDNDWRVKKYSLGSFNQDAPAPPVDPSLPNFDSVIELAKGKKGETPSLRVVRHSAIKKKGGDNDADNDAPPPKIAVWDDSGVSKEVKAQDHDAEILIYQMHAPLYSGPLWGKLTTNVGRKILAERLTALKTAKALTEGGDQGAFTDADQQALSELEGQVLAKAEKEIKARNQAIEEAELEDRKKAKLEAFEGLAQKDLSTIVVIDANDLRADGIRISRGISWERTMEDCKDNIDKIYAKMKIDLGQGTVNVMEHGVHLLVRFGYEGVLHLRPIKNNQEQPFVFHMVPNMAEGDLLRPYHGRMSGIHLAFVTGLAACLARQPKAHLSEMGRTQIGLAIELAIVWSHRFATTGFYKDAGGRLNYPEAKDINNYKTPKTKVIYGDQNMAKKESNWSLFSILKQKRHPVAAEVVKLGTERLEASIPTAKFGKVQTADRIEIEGYRSTASVIHEYLNNKVKKPLSIAVFGQPGAGKSFGVKEVIKAVLNKDEDWEPIEANLSQFLQYSDLVHVFDKIRDTSLKGDTPVVLFDEFDSAFNGPLGWLKYFLAPMQDGEFLDSGFVRPLGRAIFIFIGGTSSTFSGFKYGTEARARKMEAAERKAREKVATEKKAVEEATAIGTAANKAEAAANEAQAAAKLAAPNKLATAQEAAAAAQEAAAKEAVAKAAKAAKEATDARIAAEKHIRNLAAKNLTDDDKKAKKPDFVSRLSAHINVKGPNESDDGDVMFVMRRAMLLQGQLGKHFKAHVKDIHVDETVLNALLKHKHFPNGTRSIELILQSSTISSGRRFESSDLPSAEQLSMHVGDVVAFHTLIDEPIEMAAVRPVDIDLYNKLMWARLEKDTD